MTTHMTKTWFVDGQIIEEPIPEAEMNTNRSGNLHEVMHQAAWDSATRVPEGDIRALKHRIHELEGEVVGYKQILDTQPEPAKCDGGQCGIGGYCKECPKPLVKLKEMLEVQGRNGTWNYDHYFHGMYNGMEVMLAVLEGREPVFREAPKKWLSKKEWVGLTDAEAMEIEDKSPDIRWAIIQAEAKLKEKNT